MALVHFLPGTGDQAVDQIVGFHALAFAAAHFDVGLFRVLGRNFVAELLGAARRQRDHIVGEMLQPIGLFGVAERAESLLDDLLRVRLARIDDVVHLMGVAEFRGARLVGCGIRHPSFMAVGMTVKLVVVKIAAEQTEFPKVVGDVLADVGDGAARSYDDLGVGELGRFFLLGGRRIGARGRFLVGRKLHHPAPGVFSAGGELNRALRFQLLERGVPEFQMQYFAFAREQVVVDAQAVERTQVGVNDGGGDEIGHFRDVAVAFFDVLQRLRTQFETGLVFREPLRYARIEIPAEIIELRRGGEFFDFREGFRLDVRETEDHVGDLHAGVVDVILHFHSAAGVAEDAAESVAEHGVA